MLQFDANVHTNVDASVNGPLEMGVDNYNLDDARCRKHSV